ncbi:YsnF/AvaK domain-containing protein [Saccharothrix hoggarensis]|uniref:YsnF/AvaK domain-containing protein n=1 Tax=Saccharothrix hoggarensis TaxID=913853 RepID=A0ABW3QUY2_9PSEU
MTSIMERITHWNGREVRDQHGDKIGTVEQVWTTDDTRPDWLSVNTGLFGLRQSFLPVQGLTEGPGGDLRTPYTKEQVKDAPNVDPDGGLDATEVQRLYRHYGNLGSAHGTTTRDRTDHRADDAMTRSEEHLRVGTQDREAGRARLRKYVVTDTEQVDVPVRREELRVEREPITETNRREAMTGPAISEAEHEVTLHEERPVVDREAVPVERVRLAKEQVTDTETVSGQVRKEHIDTEGATDRNHRR